MLFRKSMRCPRSVPDQGLAGRGTEERRFSTVTMLTLLPSTVWTDLTPGTSDRILQPAGSELSGTVSEVSAKFNCAEPVTDHAATNMTMRALSERLDMRD